MVAVTLARQLKREKETNSFTIWASEAMARQKTLMSWDKFNGKPNEAQSDEEMWAAMESWVAAHNAKWQTAQAMGAES